MDVLDGVKEEVQKIIKDILQTFTTSYVKHYALGLVKKIEDDASKEPGPDWKLTPRPDSNAEPLKAGNLIKKGAIHKTWKKRWFVVRPDYVVEYHETQSKAKAPKAKPKGKIFLAGYKVVADPNDGAIQKIEKLAAQLKMDISELPKPKKYPEVTLELTHPRRRCYLLKVETVEEKENWVHMFRHVCWHAWGLENRDPVHVHAFYTAIRDCRWALGRWGWYSTGGSETQLLSDLISDEIEAQTLEKVFEKLHVIPGMVRRKARDSALKVLDTLVSAGVTPAWGAMSKVVEELRPKAEPIIKELVDPLAKLKEELIEKLKDGCMDIIKPLLEEHVIPHLAKILEIIKSPVVTGYEVAGKLLEKQLGVFASKFDATKPEENFRELDTWSRWSFWEARSATQEFDILYDPLWALHEIFHDIYPWSSIYHGQNELRKMLDNAVWTYQIDIKKAVEEKTENPCESANVDVLKKFEEDAKTATTLFYFKIFSDIINPFLNKLVLKPCNKIIEPLSDMIPDTMKQFIDPAEMFDKLVKGIVDDTIKTIIEG